MANIEILNKLATWPRISSMFVGTQTGLSVKSSKDLKTYKEIHSIII
jgi:hypothetical protein